MVYNHKDKKYVSSTLELLTKRIWIKEKGIKKLKLGDDSMLKSSIFICFKVKLQNVRARRDQRLPKFMDFEVETLVTLHRPEQTLSHENSGCPKLPSKFLAQEEFDLNHPNLSLMILALPYFL